MSRQTTVIIATVALWALACAATEFVSISAFLHSDTLTDEYARHWGFQLLVFGISQFPIWLFGLAVFICGELFYFRHRSQSSDFHAP